MKNILILIILLAGIASADNSTCQDILSKKDTNQYATRPSDTVCLM